MLRVGAIQAAPTAGDLMTGGFVNASDEILAGHMGRYRVQDAVIRVLSQSPKCQHNRGVRFPTAISTAMPICRGSGP